MVHTNVAFACPAPHDFARRKLLAVHRAYGDFDVSVELTEAAAVSHCIRLVRLGL